ncbi:MAG TPA: hypothetical protein VGD53_17240 [Actinoallomurus sp.]|jgi:virginiamycin B lyase
MRPSGHPSLREFSIADPHAGPYGITTGADGALWLALWAALETGGVARLIP